MYIKMSSRCMNVPYILYVQSLKRWNLKSKSYYQTTDRSLQLTYKGRKLASVCSDCSPQKKTQISITCSCPHSLYLSFSMLFNFPWFLPCWCVSQLIQNPTEFSKGKKWEKRPRKREREDGRMRLIRASLLFMADRLRAAEPLCSSCMCECYSETERLKKDRHGKHAQWHFLIKYGNQGANQQHTICNPF